MSPRNVYESKSFDINAEPPTEIIELAKRKQKELDEDADLEDVVLNYLGEIKIEI